MRKIKKGTIKEAQEQAERWHTNHIRCQDYLPFCPFCIRDGFVECTEEAAKESEKAYPGVKS